MLPKSPRRLQTPEPDGSADWYRFNEEAWDEIAEYLGIDRHRMQHAEFNLRIIRKLKEIEARLDGTAS